MEICSKKGIKVITGIMAATLLLGGCTVNTNNTEDTKPKRTDKPKVKTEINLSKVPETKYDKETMDKLYRSYCFDLFSQTVKDDGGDGNLMISPASVMIALDMVAAGSKNESLKQLTDLFAAGQGPLTQQAYAAKLMDTINSAQNVEFSCANAVWSNKKLLGDKVNSEYIDYIQKTFDAEYNLSNFDKKTVEEINDWVDKKTNHMIDEIINKLDDATVMVLVNAIAFEGKWQKAYKETQVNDGEFNGVGGTQTVSFLYCNESTYFETEKATGFLKNYAGGDYAFLAILPTDDKISANEFAKNFTAEDYEKFIKSATYDYKVQTVLPEFKYDYDVTLNNTIENMGCKSIFYPQSADLSGIVGNQGDIYVSEIIHKTHIEVTREGTKAAAATAVSNQVGAAMPEEQEFRFVECDRPFVYAIVDTNTMAPVFIGTVNEI
ncbi:MAG: serpin family protein [Clostridiales bacterium]|nr:serpin family protein [Clostridiales bacterium]